MNGCVSVSLERECVQGIVWRAGAGTNQGRLSDEGDQAGRKVEGEREQIIKVKHQQHWQRVISPPTIFEGVDPCPECVECVCVNRNKVVRLIMYL